MKQQKQNQIERRIDELLVTLLYQEEGIFCATTFKDKGKIMSIKFKRMCDVEKSPTIHHFHNFVQTQQVKPITTDRQKDKGRKSELEGSQSHSNSTENTSPVGNTPQEEKNNSEGSHTDYLETQKTTEEVNKTEYKSDCPDNHPVGVCIMCLDGFCNSDYNKGKECNGITHIREDCPYKNGGSFAMSIYDKKNERKDNHPIGSYVYLHDVIGLFKNRKATKTRVNQRRNIIEHLNKLRRYEVK